jgi:topoisomerase-4 subunit B
LYCYSEDEKNAAINNLGGKPEITRFKGLGEISPEEFGLFIGESMRLEPIIIKGKTSVSDLLKYFMGKNTEERQNFIIDNLRIEIDELEEVYA